MKNKEEGKEAKKAFVNPIDIDKVAENPGLLPYAHTVGGAVIKPDDLGKIKGRAMQAMYEQTDMQMDQIQEQITLLARQAKEIHERKLLSEEIYKAQVGFNPIISHMYHVYRRKNDELMISMVSPNEWGRTMPFKSHVATVTLLADHTWNVLEINEDLLNME